MATINAARALGLDDRIGSLETGKEADIAAIDLGAIETQPIYNPVSQIVYSASRDQVTDVWVAGRHLLKNNRLALIDTEQLLANVARWQRQIAAS